MIRSRLSRREERQSKKNFIFSVLAIIIIAFSMVKFGIPLLINMSLFIAGSKKSDDTGKKKFEFVAPPSLHSLPSATNSASIIVSGTAEKDEKISLYLNDELISKTDTEDSGDFEFKTKLQKGQNTITLKAINKEEQESEMTQPLTVVFQDSAPTLSVDSPSDGKSFSKDDSPITVSGKTDPGNSVTVNDFRAIVSYDGSFSYRLSLQNGENKIKIVARDQAGNKTEKEVKVNYSQ